MDTPNRQDGHHATTGRRGSSYDSAAARWHDVDRAAGGNGHRSGGCAGRQHAARRGGESQAHHHVDERCRSSRLLCVLRPRQGVACGRIGHRRVGLSADRGVLGCKLNAAAILPRTTPFPAPFSTAFLTGTTANLRVAPVLIGQNQSDSAASDVLVVMSGSGRPEACRARSNGRAAPRPWCWKAPRFRRERSRAGESKWRDGLLTEEVGTITAPTLNVGGTTYYTATGTANDPGDPLRQHLDLCHPPG